MEKRLSIATLLLRAREPVFMMKESAEMDKLLKKS